MLILTRKPGEQIRINDDITVTVISAKGSQVRIGIEAPRNVDIHRVELETDKKPLDEPSDTTPSYKKPEKITKKPL